MRRLLIVLFVLTGAAAKAAPIVDTPNIPFDRIHFHDRIRDQQKLTDKQDGKEDGSLRVSSNEALNLQATDALFRRVTDMRFWIEENPAVVGRNEKVRYLRYVESLLTSFRAAWRGRQINATEFSVLIGSFENILRARVANQSILGFLDAAPYEVARINAAVFADTADAQEAANIVYKKYAALNPEKILQTIAPYADQDFADSLIVLACKKNPVQFYNYAQSRTSATGKLIHRNTNPMVKAVAELSQTENALFYFPFFDDILAGRKKMEHIKSLVGNGENKYDSVGYFKLLTATATDYFIRTAAKDTPVAYFGANGLQETLKSRAAKHFIGPINALHDQSNLAVRMRAIQPLSPAELYYMMVLNEDIIYTSSYKHSFNRMLQLMGSKPRGDSLLLTVNFDHFKKFIKMAANYNKLDTFLKTMPAARAEILMQNFVANLDKTGSLEDATDVADSYSSIANKVLQRSMMSNVITNLDIAKAENNQRGQIIYGLLKTIFESADENNTTDLSAQIGIPSIYEVPNKYLQDAEGRIIQQVYWYGDEDGKLFYPQFKNSFAPADWKVTEKKEWLEAVSAKGNVMVFANRPLDNDANLDDTAQYHLADYLDTRNMLPAITVHRGHSYWLPRTLDRMAGDAKIVVLGSCGGYQNLSKILAACPDAHIISTKEIGAGDINRPILNYMNKTLAAGENLNWRTMWQSLTKTFASDPSKTVRESWEDYIPPYKNLGAIFLKAYTRMMANAEELPG